MDVSPPGISCSGATEGASSGEKPLRHHPSSSGYGPVRGAILLRYASRVVVVVVGVVGVVMWESVWGTVGTAVNGYVWGTVGTAVKGSARGTVGTSVEI